MTSKEVLERYFSNLLYGNGGFQTDEEELEGLNAIKQDLERLEVLEKEKIALLITTTAKNEIINLCKKENEKLKKAIALLNLLFNFEVDVETETIYCCLGDVSVNGANLIEDFELLKEVINNE